MINVLEKIEFFASKSPDRIAFESVRGSISYGKLWECSEVLAGRIGALEAEGIVRRGEPIAVFGHKEPEMLVSFVACARMGHPYCPLDRSMPESRIKDILAEIGTSVMIRCEDEEAKIFQVPESILGEKCRDSAYHGDPERSSTCCDDSLNGKSESSSTGCDDALDENVMYIIFTSGSTGKPKGVEVTSENLGNFLEWMTGVATDIGEKEGKVFLNQAPYSFDLSVMDTYTALASGGTIASLDKEVLANPARTMDFLREKKPEYWISTPSFVDMILAEKDFTQENFPHIHVFYFCGERLTKATAEKLMTAFPDSKVINTYGPTESTVAISQVEIKREHIEAEDELPVGQVKPGTTVLIGMENGEIATDKEDGKIGEILIEGNTVAKGYFRAPEKTDAAFEKTPADEKFYACEKTPEDEKIYAGEKTPEGSEGSKSRRYHTGDLGYFKAGQLYCIGRTDLQVKVHGYRMELGDIEANILSMREVEAVCVVPKRSDGKIRSLTGFVVAPSMEGTFGDGKKVKAHLKELLPEYMVPKKIKFIESLPMTANGKIDRKKLEEEA